jgi:hypothetical protein
VILQDTGYPAGMASLYNRGNVIWMCFRDEDGKWCNRSTGYRKSSPGERR